MDTVLLLQIVFIFVMFACNILCAFIPLKIVPNDPNKLVSQRSQRIISLCGCISGGVFLGTCYLQLIPYLQKKFQKVFAMSGANMNYCELTTQCTIMAGVFLILLIEQSVHVWQDSKDGCTDKARTYAVITNDLPVSGELIELPDGGYIASSDSSLSDESDTDDPKKHMLKKLTTSTTQSSTGVTLKGNKGNLNSLESGNNINSKKNSNTLNKPQGHTSFTRGQGHVENHSHVHQSGGGHGHSHIADLVTGGHGVLRSLLLLAALSIHSLFEGMAVGLQETIMNLINLFIGVLLHECLIAFSVGISLAQQQSHMKRGTVYKLCIAFSLMIPVGMAIGLIIGGLHGFHAELVSALIQGVAAGTFVYVIFFEILPAEINTNQDRLLKVLFIFLGFGVILCLQISMNEN